MSNIKEQIQRYPASRLIDVAKALSGDLRLRILEALGEKSMSISQLAAKLGVAQPTITINIQLLRTSRPCHLGAWGESRENMLGYLPDDIA